MQYSEQVGKYEDKAWEEDIENFYQINQGNYVICPFCKKNQLLENKNVIFCKCGFKLNVKMDQIGLNYLGNRLKQLTHQHSEKCFEVPNFNLKNNFGGSEMISMSCTKCNTFEIVI